MSRSFDDAIARLSHPQAASSTQAGSDELDDLPSNVLRELRGSELRESAIKWRGERNTARNEARQQKGRADRLQRELDAARAACRRLASSTTPASGDGCGDAGHDEGRCGNAGCITATRAPGVDDAIEDARATVKWLNSEAESRRGKDDFVAGCFDDAARYVTNLITAAQEGAQGERGAGDE